MVHEYLIKQTLQALRNPKQIAIVHRRGHQKGKSDHIRGNNLADEEAKKAALLIVKELGIGESKEQKQYEKRFSTKEKERLLQMGIEEKDGKWLLPDGREVLPKGLAWRVMREFHRKTHWGIQALVDRFSTKYMCIGVYDIAKAVLGGCLTCRKVNKQHLRERIPGGRELALRPFAKIQIDFTELPKTGRSKYLLLIIDHPTYYVKAFPVARATAQTVVKI